MKKLIEKANELSIKCYLKFKEEDGIGSIELVLILVALIALVIVFKDGLKQVLSGFLGKIEGQANDIFK